MPYRISRFAIPDIASVPEDVRERMLAVQEKAGFIPNIFLALAHRPAEFRAFFAYHDALMDKAEGLSLAEREMIVVATSGLNKCRYCIVAHGAILRIRAKNSSIDQALSTDYQRANLTPRQRAMLDYAAKLSIAPWEITDNDCERMLKSGFTQEELWDIGAITALFALSNRLAHMSDLEPNPEFTAMGKDFPANTD